MLILEDPLVPEVDDVVPGLAAKQEDNCLEKGLSVKVEQKCQSLLICDKINDIEDVRPELRLNKIALRELLSLQKERKDPKKLIANIEAGLLNLVFTVLVSILEQLDVLLGHLAISFVTRCRCTCARTHYFVLLSDRFLCLHVVE